MYNAIISGAGHSGSQCAEHLVKTGYKVALIPSEDFLFPSEDFIAKIDD